MSNKNYSTEKDFEHLVEKAIAGLPGKFRKAVRNLEIIIQDRPDRQLVREMGRMPKDELLGLYVGVPLPERTYGWEPVLPDRIFLFRLAHEKICRTPEEFEEQIKRTLIHELAHYFGFDENYLGEIGMG